MAMSNPHYLARRSLCLAVGRHGFWRDCGGCFLWWCGASGRNRRDIASLLRLLEKRKYLWCFLFFALHYAEPRDVLLRKTRVLGSPPKQRKRLNKTFNLFLGWPAKPAVEPNILDQLHQVLLHYDTYSTRLDTLRSRVASLVKPESVTKFVYI